MKHSGLRSALIDLIILQTNGRSEAKTSLGKLLGMELAKLASHHARIAEKSDTPVVWSFWDSKEMRLIPGRNISSRICAYCKDFTYPGGGIAIETDLVGDYFGLLEDHIRHLPKCRGQLELMMFHMKQSE